MTHNKGMCLPTKWLALLSVFSILGGNAFADIQKSHEGPVRSHDYVMPERLNTYEAEKRYVPKDPLQVPKLFFPPNPRVAYDPNKTSSGPAVQDTSWDFEPTAPNIISNFAGPHRNSGVGGDAWTPPDPEIAVGPGHVVVIVNDDVFIYNKSGSQQSAFDANSFFNSSDTFFDPKVIYDGWRSRWVILYLRMNTSSQSSSWAIAISDDNDPRGSYWAYSFNARIRDGVDTNFWADYPQLGFDANAVYLSAIMFPWSSGAHHPKLICLNKDQIYNGQGAGAHMFWNLTSQGSYDLDLMPAEQWTDWGQHFVVSAKRNGNTSKLALRRITWPNGANWTERWNNGPAISAPELIEVGTYNVAPDGQQPGGAATLENIDCRLLSASMNGSYLFTIHTIAYNWGSGNRAAIRPYKINVGNTPATVDASTIYGQETRDYIYPAVHHLSDNDMVISFGRTAGDTNPEARVTGWREGGAIEGSSTVKAGEASYERLANGRNRWGDYFGAALDITNFRKVWVVGQYARSNNNWGTWVAQTEYPSRAASSMTVSNASGTVGQTVALSATLRGILNVPLINQTVHFKVDGIAAGSAVTNASGVATINYAIPDTIGSGAKTIEATFNRIPEYYESTGTATLTVNKANTVMTANNLSHEVGRTVALVARLQRSGDNVDLAGKTISFTVAGNPVGSAVTNASGQASLNYTIPEGLGVGARTVNASFAGDTAYNTSNVNFTLTVNKADVSLVTINAAGQCDQTVVLSATLRRLHDSFLLANRPVQFTVNGQVIGSVNTNASGVATINYTIPPSQAAGNQPINAQFAGDSLYNAGQGNATLTVQNTAPVATIAGSTLWFDGMDDFAQVPNFGNMAPTTEITIEFWQRSDSTRASATIDINGSTSNNRIVVHSPWSDGAVYFDFGNIGTTGRLAYTPPAGSLSQWNHFAFVASQSGNYMRIYRNGVLEAQRSGSSFFTRGAFPLNIAGGGSAPARFQGSVDELRIWDKARSQKDIQRDMNAVLIGNEANLISYWRMDEGHGTTMDNSVSGAPNGTLNNGARFFASGAAIDTVNVFFPTMRPFRLGAYDVNNNTLAFQILTTPTRGVLTGTLPNLNYIPARGGQDQMTYRAADGVAFSGNAMVKFRTWVTGDVNSDGCVNDDDLLAVLFAFGQTGGNLLEDLNEDGAVNDDDLLIVLFNFGAGC